MTMTSGMRRPRIDVILLCLFVVLIATGSSDAWRRRRRRRAPPPPPPPDRTAPTFTYCPWGIGNQYTTSTSTSVSWSTPTATDNRGSASVSITSGSGPGSTFGAGSHSTIYTARDAAGNQATCTVSFAVVVIRCTSLSSPSHGSLSCSNSANVGSRCTYSCSTGYRTSGGSVTRTCSRVGNSGSWSGSAAPSCVRITCSALSRPSSGVITCSDGSYYNSRCTFTCNGGYTLSGSSTRTCQSSGSWTGSDISCADTTAPVFTSCPSSFTVYAPELSSAATVSWSAPTVSDNSGQSITPRQTSGSGSGGSFSEGTHAIAFTAADSSGNDASCLFSVTVSVIRCSTLSASAPLQVSCQNGAIRGSVCTYGCGTGYRLQGQGSTECQKSGSVGSWSQPPPTCQILQCPSLAAPSNGRIVGSCSRNYGSRCTFACNTGYEINNDARQCSARAGSTNAFWVGATPTCTRILCRKPSLTTALQIATTPSCPSGDFVPSGNQCAFSCSAGYYLSGNAALTCLHDRTWNHPTPTCRLITCTGSSLPAPANGEKRGCSSSRENYGMVCTLACNLGYRPAAPVQRTCSDDGDGDGDGIWAGPDLSCSIVTCPPPATPANGVVSGCQYQGSAQAVGGTQKYSTACSFSCSTGFTQTAGSARRVCQASSQWDGQPVVCEDTTPPVFVCPSNKHLFAGQDSTSAAVPWGNWEPVMGTDREAPLQSELYTVDSTEIGSVKPISLPEGTHRVVYRGTDMAGLSATCSFDVEVHVTRCPPTPVPDHGAVALISGEGRCEEGAVYGADCRVTCDVGYRLSSDAEYIDRACERLSDTSPAGYWTAQNERCNVKNCSVPVVMNGNSVDCTSPKVAYQTRCEFRCHPGYMSPSGVESIVRTCRADETWSELELQCSVAKTCPAMFDIDHGSVDHPECELADVRFGTRCEFSCDEGYQLQGPAALACSTEGEWNHDVRPSCTDTQPPSFNGPCPRHMTVDAEPGTTQALVNYNEPIPSDNSGLVNLTRLDSSQGPRSVFMEGETTVGYLATDSSGLSSRCDVVITIQVYRCPVQQPPLHGLVEGCPDPFHGCQCQFSCDIGYDLVGEDTLSCDLSPESNPVWSHARPVCQIRTCPPLVIQAPATLTGCGQPEENVPYGSVCTFHCPFGYEGVGESEKRCQADRTWTSTDFICIRKTCPLLVETDEISVMPVSCLSDPRFEDTCSTSCKTAGFEISPPGLSEIVCSGNQTWTKDVAKAQCIDVEAPTFAVCSPDIVVYTGRGSNQTNVQWVVQATDNSGIDPQVTCDLSTGVMTSGSYVVTCVARDDAGNENICRFLVDVIVRTCPIAFEPPLFGTLSGPCDRSHGSVCHLTCLVGYDLVGSGVASCEFDGTEMYWKTEVDPYCQVIGCDALMIDPSLSVSPSSCATSEKVHAGTTCTLYCDHDLTLVGSVESLTCLDNGEWSSGRETYRQLRCLDRAAPVINSCPSQPILVERTEFWGVEVTFDLPSATDNLDNDLLISTDPIDLASPYNFTTDTTCTYSFTDHSNNTALCVFQVSVTNNVQPVVEFCPHDQNITTSTKMTRVEWEEPVFLAPPGIEIAETCNYGNSPALLPWGHHVIMYQASNGKNGLKADCRINVDITPIPCHDLHVPANGALACDDGFAYGRYCTMVCNEGYDVPRLRSSESPKKLFVCGSSGMWYPHSSVPDCSRRRKPRRMNLPLSMMYFEGKCSTNNDDDETTQAISEKFVNIISQTNFAEICTKNELCKVDHVEVTCGPGNYRRKREVVPLEAVEDRGGRSVAYVNMILTMASDPDDFEINRNHTEVMYNLARHIHKHTKKLLTGGSGGMQHKAMQDFHTSISDVRSGTSWEKTEEKHNGGHFGDESDGLSKQENIFADRELGLVLDGLVSECEDGYIADQELHTCIACPAGYYFQSSLGECVECERGSYQDEQAQSQCKPCVNGTWTRERGARHAGDCEVLCETGSYSASGFAPCIPCQEGAFLPLKGQTQCFDCPLGLSSPSGSQSPEDCQEPCPAGQYSSTGLQPCKPCPAGTYQPHKQQKTCSICPGGTEDGATSIGKCSLGTSGKR